jgi:hypothetical protein
MVDSIKAIPFYKIDRIYLNLKNKNHLIPSKNNSNLGFNKNLNNQKKKKKKKMKTILTFKTI